MTNKLEKYRYLWERDTKKYVLLHLIDDFPAIFNPYSHSMIIIDDDIDTIKKITDKMIEAGVERITSFEDLYRKYPAPPDL